MRNSLLVLAVLALAPVYAQAQVAGKPPAAAVASPPTPSGADTPTAAIPGTPAVSAPANVDLPLPSVDSAGANRSNSSTTGEVKAPIGAPRLPGEPLNPPSGPSD